MVMHNGCLHSKLNARISIQRKVALIVIESILNEYILRGIVLLRLNGNSKA